MHAHEITVSGLIKLPVIFAAVGVLGFGTSAIPTDGAAIAYIASCLALSVWFGIWRGERIDVWRDAGRWMSQGNRTTIGLWAALIGVKVALGTVASITGLFPAEHAATCSSTSPSRSSRRTSSSRSGASGTRRAPRR